MNSNETALSDVLERRHFNDTFMDKYGSYIGAHRGVIQLDIKYTCP